MTNIQELKKRLDKAADIGEVLDRRLYSLAVITECLSIYNIIPILVGVAAVEFCTVGGYATKDVDVIVEPTQEFASVKINEIY